MPPAIDLVRALTDPVTSTIEKRLHAASFSREFGWRPNDVLHVPSALPTVNLVVEHGLENAAMLSFLPSDYTLANLGADEQREILGLSYNSLVDWHVWIDRETVQCFYNRVESPVPTYTQGFDQSDYSALTRQVFDEAVGNAPRPDFLTLDDALFDTITTWREILHREMGTDTGKISALFNGIILARAVEDFHSRVGTSTTQMSLLDRVSENGVSIGQAIEQLVLDLTEAPVSAALFDRSALDSFATLPLGSRIDLVGAFYRHRAVPYDYDFSVMSKYALSKLYERYVAVMQENPSFQIAMLPSTGDGRWNKELGGIYTPQYIASFFAKFLRSRVPAERFIDLSVADPACGSGIFLRAAMEQKLLADGILPDLTTKPDFDSLFGVDIDENAVAAARLSLALLHLAARRELPASIPVIHADSLEYFSDPSDSSDLYDVVMVNPPFIRTELQSDVVREAIRNHADVGVRGKLDTYLAFLVFSIRALRPGGFGCFVVPQSLLISDPLKPLRDWVLEQASVHVIADLSAIRVFKADIYVVLLIVQKKSDAELKPPAVSVIRCQRDAGLALDDFLDGNYLRTSSHLIFKSEQSSLSRSTWSIPLPEEANLLEKLEAMHRLNEVAEVQQGVITGADDVFIVDAHNVPLGEEDIYARFMPGTQIGRYVLPSDTDKRIFYPYIDGVPVDATRMERDFPATWERLNQFRHKLSNRRSAPKDPSEWWRLSWPRSPHDMLAPKIVVPKLCLLPRFGIDKSGKWIVSNLPLVKPRSGDGDLALLHVLAAILNSSVAAWFIDLNGRKFRNGYSEVAVSLLRRLPIPDLGQVPKSAIQSMADSVIEIAGSYQDFDHGSASALDDVVLRDLYRLEQRDIEILKPQDYS